MQTCKSIEWQSVQLQINNHIGVCVNRTDYARFEKWNALIHELKAALLPLVEQYVVPLSKQLNLPKRFELSVRWDLNEICVETEFGDICKPIFFLERVLPWYQAGHFPCGWDGPILKEGWEGPMPAGRLIVY